MTVFRKILYRPKNGKLSEGNYSKLYDTWHSDLFQLQSSDLLLV